MMKQLMTLQFALQSDLMTTIRLTTGGVCSLAGLSLDGSEDCKVCVTESLLLLRRGGYESARVSYFEEAGIRVRVEGAGSPVTPAEEEGEEISVALLNALVDEITMERSDGRICAVAFRFEA